MEGVANAEAWLLAGVAAVHALYRELSHTPSGSNFLDGLPTNIGLQCVVLMGLASVLINECARQNKMGC